MMVALDAVVLDVLDAASRMPPERSDRVRLALAAPAGWARLLVSAIVRQGGIVRCDDLARRVTDKDAIRASRIRRSVFAAHARPVARVAGDLFRRRSAVPAMLLLPAMFVGMAIGNRITTGLTREQFLRVLYVVLIASGTSLLLRAWSLA